MSWDYQQKICYCKFFFGLCQITPPKKQMAATAQKAKPFETES